MTADFTITRVQMSWTITVPDDRSGLTFTRAKIYTALRDIGYKLLSQSMTQPL